MEQELNLYFDLEPGQFADLEVIAKASLSFAEAVREIAYIVDPSLTIRLEFESGTDGSLSVNSILRFVRQQVADPVVRKTIIVAIVLWFAKESAAALIGLGIDDVLHGDVTISQQDAEIIADKVLVLLEKRVGAKHVQQVFKEIDKDKSIQGVGVGTIKGARPKSIVPREEFQERSRDPSEEETEPGKRTRPERMMLTLISPVLQKNNNKWRFLSKDGNIFVGISDERFLADVLSGRAGITMKSGIVIIADVDVTEKRVDSVWEVVDRNITHVVEIRSGDGMDDLLSK